MAPRQSATWSGPWNTLLRQKATVMLPRPTCLGAGPWLASSGQPKADAESAGGAICLPCRFQERLPSTTRDAEPHWWREACSANWTNHIHRLKPWADNHRGGKRTALKQQSAKPEPPSLEKYGEQQHGAGALAGAKGPTTVRGGAATLCGRKPGGARTPDG